MEEVTGVCVERTFPARCDGLLKLKERMRYARQGHFLNENPFVIFMYIFTLVLDMYIYVYVIGLVHSKGEYTICKRNGRWKWLWVYAKKGSLSNNRTLLRYIFPTSQRVELAFADLTNTQRRDGINATTDNIYTYNQKQYGKELQ